MKLPLPTIFLALSVVAVSTLSLPAEAQGRVYRCGNEYTNQIKGRSDCKPVEGGNVTVVQGTRPAAAPEPARSSSPAAPRTASGGTAPAAPRIDTPEQRARDSDARSILEQELKRAEVRREELLKEYNNGQPDRLGNERNYQKYLDRVAELKASIERNQSDIDGLKREISRLR